MFCYSTAVGVRCMAGAGMKCQIRTATNAVRNRNEWVESGSDLRKTAAFLRQREAYANFQC